MSLKQNYKNTILYGKKKYLKKIREKTEKSETSPEKSPERSTAVVFVPYNTVNLICFASISLCF